MSHGERRNGMSNAELENKYADETLEQLSEWIESQGQVWLQRHHVEDYRRHKHKSAQAAAMERLFYQIKHRLDAAIKRREAEQNKPEKNSGNAAELREALEKISNMADLYPRIPRSAFANTARSALAAPARNCDRFHTVDEAFKAWESDNKKPPEQCFLQWLFAPAEGGKEKANDATH